MYFSIVIRVNTQTGMRYFPFVLNGKDLYFSPGVFNFRKIRELVKKLSVVEEWVFINPADASSASSLMLNQKRIAGFDCSKDNPVRLALTETSVLPLSKTWQIKKD